MIGISVSADISQMLRRIEKIRSQVPFATALALTRTGQFVKVALVEEMREVFRNPVPYTLNAIYSTSATKQLLQSIVGVKNQNSGRISPLHWLLTEIQGGSRNVKALEKAFGAAGFLPSGWTAIPGGGAKLDSYGNVSGGQIQTVLTQLRQAATAGSRTLMRRTRGGKTTLSPYFVVGPEDSARMHTPPGIYQRFGKESRKCIFFFLPRIPSYQRRFDFYEVAERTARAIFPTALREAMASALASAK